MIYQTDVVYTTQDDGRYCVWCDERTLRQIRGMMESNKDTESASRCSEALERSETFRNTNYPWGCKD